MVATVEAVVGVNGPLGVRVELVPGVRVRAAGRVGAADFLVAVIGQVEVVFLFVGLEVLGKLIVVLRGRPDLSRRAQSRLRSCAELFGPGGQALGLPPRASVRGGRCLDEQNSGRRYFRPVTANMPPFAGCAVPWVSNGRHCWLSPLWPVPVRRPSPHTRAG